MMNCLKKNKDPDADQSSRDGKREKKREQETDRTLRTLDIYGLKAYQESRSKSAKIFWLVLLLSCTGIFVWQLYKTITNYINSPIVSTYTITTVSAMDFPKVYICPTSLINSEYIKNHSQTAERDAIALKEEMGLLWDYADFLASGNLSNAVSGKVADPLAHVDPSGLRALRQTSRHLNQTGSLMESEKDAEEFFKNATIDLDNNLRYCEFRVFMVKKINCSEIAKEVLDPQLGKCYLIDVGEMKQTVQSQALIMTYNVRSASYPKSSVLSPSFNGVYLSIQRHYNVDQSGERVLLTPGNYYRVDLTAQHQVFKNFEHPYQQKCITDDSYPTFQIYNVPYTQQACLYDCAAQTIKEICKCILPIDRLLYKEEIKNTTNFCKIKDLSCIRNITKTDNNIRELYSCRNQCERPCEDWRYSIRATSMDLYPYGYDVGVPVYDLMYILVSFTQMEYTEFKQNGSKTPDQMIADIGGEASLWLGAGMLTVIQMPLFFVATCGGCFKKGAKKFRKRETDADNESGNSK